jgi:hypothetical protein
MFYEMVIRVPTTQTGFLFGLASNGTVKKSSLPEACRRMFKYLGRGKKSNLGGAAGSSDSIWASKPNLNKGKLFARRKLSTESEQGKNKDLSKSKLHTP